MIEYPDYYYVHHVAFHSGTVQDNFKLRVDMKDCRKLVLVFMTRHMINR
jgi:hypothetical protein